MKSCKVPEKVRVALEATGLPYDFEPGGHHMKIKLAGRLVGILPMAGGTETDRRTVLNVVSQIRRQGATLR